MKFRFVFWDVLPCKIIVDRRFRGTFCLHHQGALMMESARTSETSVNYFTWQYIPENKSEQKYYFVGGEMGSKWILGRLAWGVWIGFDCLRTGTGGGLL
jgi:hypothetical protein